MYKNLEPLDCYGEETRKSIVRDYNIKLLIYAKLLNGRTKHSDAHDTLTDRYYEFLCINKTNENIQRSITCGSGAGEHLIKLAKLKRPKIFNPLIGEGNGAHGGGGNGSDTSNETWDPLAEELYNAIRWLICCWDIIPYGKLLDIKKGLEDYPYREPFASKIVSVNNIIRKDKRKRIITKMIDELRVNNNIRNYNFYLINSILKEMDISSFF
ncbi:hypothetical protein B0P06_002227 [Clostridium saccharoperbutylacetonicum]|uniref:Uncharacterized protein n=1 Tax=Clostridium saccharoperbutylacetonicum N1-4(HMT) TaxID=931276 RepID=M1MNG7_9CLOT|nr:hypothetical protein [Clostridium saccharoperbutylacetonicum]AGF59434.1 hypothetical protein Cspa_c57090 [Clostridium saccharoperbutylacetonicum N1-4(HMT)]NRT59773.1 hypothetical protein [Clostridium saccharoperbutylacetonicum]NSB23085.1 hypothetical protein [Clostridium saccharoperbutylacetonicum]NSB42456.1 hypothetical protein [Clostridium saccharoperbutylacetonicum]